MLGSQDITGKIVNNVYKIASVSSDMSLSVTFEKIPTYTLNINMTGGTGCIKVEDKTITESDCISDLKKELCLNFIFSQIIHSANTIPDKAFYNNQTLQYVYLPYSIEVIGKQSFSGSTISTFYSFEGEK